jgi:hypothetical protein
VNVYVGGHRLALDPARSIGKGGEADVFEVGGRALKLFKPPEHPDLAGDPDGQQAAQARLDEQQRKLRAFPAGLPDRVVAPLDLVTDRSGRRVLGYAMRLVSGATALLRYGERSFRQGTITADAVVAIFRDLHATLTGAHNAGVVIGDFNDLNVLVSGLEAHVVDADSFQFGPFPCRVFTERFVDPLLCDPDAPRPVLVRPHGTASDWYAYAVMLMRSLLFVDPYGGVYKPRDAGAKLAPGARPLRRVTVFHPDVRYPRPALRPDVLPDDLLQHFHCVFERDLRVPFPERLLDAMAWRHCESCGLEHARASCPACTVAPTPAVREVVRVRGTVTSTRVFHTRGEIVASALEGSRLRVLVHEAGAFRREDGTVVLEGDRLPGMRFRLSGARTLVGHGRKLAILAPGEAPRRMAVDAWAGTPAFDANERHAYWIEAGRLVREGPIAPERIGDVLAGQTRFWAGPEMGFGFYRAGELHVAFVFDASGRGLNDGVALAAPRGQLVDAGCVFGAGGCWFWTTTRDAGRTIHRCSVVSARGAVLASVEGPEGSWLADLRGACAAGGFLLVPTDEGLVRVEVEGATLRQTRLFPDTEPFVDAGCRLWAGSDGLYVVDRHEVRRLSMA